MKIVNEPAKRASSAVARFAGLGVQFVQVTWGLRSRLYAAACFAGSGPETC